MSTNPPGTLATEQLAAMAMLGDFPTILRAARKECGVTQSEVAAVCGVAREAVSQWEAGTIRPSADSLAKLGALFSKLSPLIKRLPLIKMLQDNETLEECLPSDESVIDILRTQRDVLMDIGRVLSSLSRGQLL